MKHIPHTSRVFIGLLIISLLLTYIAITLSHYNERLIFDYGQSNKVGAQDEPIALVDTKDWDGYQDRAYPIAFSHPSNWTVSSKLTEGFYDITVNIPETNNDIHIYIDDESYLGLEGLTTENYKENGTEGIIVNNNLIGIKEGEYYYTFDGSMSQANLNEFRTLVKTAVFK